MELLKLPNVELIKGNLYEHYSLMLRTTSIILSRSSFSDTTVFLNKHLENVFFFPIYKFLLDSLENLEMILHI
jgi:hypothetical protein